MAGPRPNDPYSPVPTQLSNEGMPADYLTTRASAEDAGAGIGRAMQGTGQALQEASNTAMDIAIKEQGMLNETFTTEGDNQLYVQQSDLVGKYRSMKGLEAVAAKDATLAALRKSREDIAKTMPNSAALRSFNLLASRREAFAYTEINNYAASQIKEASIASAKANMELAVQSIANPSVAGNDRAFGEAMGDINFSAARMIDELGYGAGSNSGMMQDGKTGAVTFDLTTENGKKADAVYRNFVSKLHSQAWENRLNTLAYDAATGNIENAVSVLQANKNNMPADTYAKMSHAFSGPYRTYQSRGIADTVFAEVEREYQGANGPLPDAGSAITNMFPGTKVTSGYRTPEENSKVHGKENSKHLVGSALDFVPPPGSTPEEFTDALSRIGFKGVKVLHEKKGQPGEHFHAQWEPNSNSLDPSTQFQTQADYVAMNYSKIINRAENLAMEKYKDPVFAQQVRTHTEQRLMDIINQQKMIDRTDQNSVLEFVYGEKNKGALITDVSQLENAPLNIRNAWHRMQLTNPVGAQQFERRILTANSQGQALTIGPDFYKYYQQVAAGEVDNPSQLYNQVIPSDGKNSPLSNTGHRVLSNIINESQTPQGKAFLNAQTDFFDKIRPKITSTPQGIKDGIGDEKFNQFLMSVLPRITAGKAKGLTADQMFDEKSPDYVGGGINIFQREPVTRFKDTVLKNIDLSGASSVNPYDNLQGDALKARLRKDKDDGKITYEAAQAYALKRGLIRQDDPAAPSVPFNPSN